MKLSNSMKEIPLKESKRIKMQIQIVTNSDRCHVSIDGVPARTFMFYDYREESIMQQREHAIHDAKAECFNQLIKYPGANINTDILSL